MKTNQGNLVNFYPRFDKEIIFQITKKNIVCSVTILSENASETVQFALLNLENDMEMKNNQRDLVNFYLCFNEPLKIITG